MAVSTELQCADSSELKIRSLSQCAPAPKRVLIVKSALEAYRLPFFNGLQERLAQDEVELRVAVPRHRCEAYQADWLVPVEGGDLHFLGKTLSWQGIRRSARGADLIIMQQCAREMSNYWLLWSRKAQGYRLALWGHGTDFQRSFTTPVARFIKRRMFQDVDYWFAYTPGVAKIVEKQGYPRERICTVFNSVNTAGEANRHRAVSEESKEALREEFGMKTGAKLVSYCGALYREKRLGFLIEACKIVRNKGVDLHLAVIGDGADRTRLEGQYQVDKWIHFVGPAHAKRKAALLASSECMTIPGVIGLAIVDSFAHECPLVTTSTSGHGPEIEYLENGINGLMVDEKIDVYAQSLIRLLTDQELQDNLREGCRAAAKEITMENMIQRFASGILMAMQLPTLA
jgi:glycosyltransferase involved in cell wall biosynthesis